RDPELRQEVDRRGDRDVARSGPGSAERVRSRVRSAMRHQRNRYQLSRSASHRKALLINLTKEIIDHERIQTTEAKAKAVKPEVERLITLAKRGDLHARRQALSALEIGRASCRERV